MLYPLHYRDTSIYNLPKVCPYLSASVCQTSAGFPPNKPAPLPHHHHPMLQQGDAHRTGLADPLEDWPATSPRDAAAVTLCEPI